MLLLPFGLICVILGDGPRKRTVCDGKGDKWCLAQEDLGVSYSFGQLSIPGFGIWGLNSPPESPNSHTKRLTLSSESPCCARGLNFQTWQHLKECFLTHFTTSYLSLLL